MNQRNRVPTTIQNSDLDHATGKYSILRQIHEGMGVYDVRDNHIGDVAFIHFGAASETQQQLGVGPATNTVADNPDLRDDSFIDDLAEAFDTNDIPQELQDRLLVSGFVRLDRGLFGTDRYITPDQITGVADDKVQLSVNKDQLVKRN